MAASLKGSSLSPFQSFLELAPIDIQLFMSKKQTNKSQMRFHSFGRDTYIHLLINVFFSAQQSQQ